LSRYVTIRVLFGHVSCTFGLWNYGVFARNDLDPLRDGLRASKIHAIMRMADKTTQYVGFQKIMFPRLGENI
jgi:hypothetical protein